jgi:hypothetical protein
MEYWKNGKSRTTTVSGLRILESIFEDFSMNVFDGSKFFSSRRNKNPIFHHSKIPLFQL